jgi:hypothetical protein
MKTPFPSEVQEEVTLLLVSLGVNRSTIFPPSETCSFYNFHRSQLNYYQLFVMSKMTFQTFGIGP